jgi:hypothetical protein
MIGVCEEEVFLEQARAHYIYLPTSHSSSDSCSCSFTQQTNFNFLPSKRVVEDATAPTFQAAVRGHLPWLRLLSQ